VVAGHEAQMVQRQKLRFAQQEADGAVLAVKRGDGADAEVDHVAALAPENPAAVGRPAALGDVHPGHRLDVGDAALAQFGGNLAHRLPQPKVPAGDALVVLLSTEEEVADAQARGVFQQAVDHERHVFRFDVDPQGVIGLLNDGRS